MTFSYWLQGAKIQTFFLLMKKLGKKSPKTGECNMGPGPRVKFSGQTLNIINRAICLLIDYSNDASNQQRLEI